MSPSLSDGVRKLVPQLFADGPISITRLETTRPVFLLFSADSTRPACVVQIGPREDLEPMRDALTTLHDRVGDLVPASFACVQWNDHQYVHIQQGLRGLPWFQVSRLLRSGTEKARIAERAQQALAQLHKAISEVPRWRSRIRPGDELRQQTRKLVAGELAARADVATLETAARSLDDLGEVDWFYQHGDFCLNNLLVGETGVGVIDFDEFGETSVPLHDEIGLGLSIYQLSSDGDNWPEAGRQVSAAVAPTLQRHPELSRYLAPLFLHFLVWRINQGAGRAARQPAIAKLTTILSTVSKDRERFFLN